MFQDLEQVHHTIQEGSIEMVDLRFCDLWGRWRHVTIPATRFGPEIMERGIAFDGSSVGFASVQSGDMVMVPDLGTGWVDPFCEVPTLSFICTTLNAGTRELFPLDPRSVARRAERFLVDSGIGTASLWGPEFEFYIFDGVAYENGMNVASYRVHSEEGDWHSHELGSGYTIPRHGGYHAIPPQDHLADLRSRICSCLASLGVPVKYHHHEVGGPGQCEIETPMLPLLAAADAVLITKYVVRMMAIGEGMTATFMPKPLFGEAGSGMHCHQRLEREGTNLFFDAAGYGSIGELGRHYIAGLLEHGAAVLAFTNPSTNSYRRLVPGFEAPVSAIYSLGNRSSAIRIPSYANDAASARIEFRPPDATSNPYLSLAAQLMAGLDGIRRRLDPGELGFGPIDEDIFHWDEARRSRIRALPTSLDEAMDALEADHDFLTVEDVFPEKLIERWIERKRWEQRQVRHRPHPYEIELYYDL